MTHVHKEVLVTTVYIALLGLLLNPFHFWMPTAMDMMLMAAVLAIFFILSRLAWEERADDEREALHLNQSRHIAYLAGTGVLMLGTVYQAWNHSIDPWLIVALSIMLLTKLMSFIYLQHYK
jgi:hypothetical protein